MKSGSLTLMLAENHNEACTNGSRTKEIKMLVERKLREVSEVSMKRTHRISSFNDNPGNPRRWSGA